jgi:hypothetical protein
MKLVTEGVNYYNSLTEAKLRALPIFPKGFTDFGAEHVSAGFETDEKIYLAVWCLGKDTTVKTGICTAEGAAKIAYPKNSTATLREQNGELTVEFTAGKQAVFLEIEK